MSLRNNALFTGEGKGTPFLRAQWTKQGASQPFLAGSSLVTDEGLATRYFAALWRAAFPLREHLPIDVALAEDDGRGTTAFWDVFDP